MRTRIDLRHQQPLHDTLARLFAEFEARGGAVQRLPQEARSGTGRTYYNGRMVGPAPPRDRRTKHRPVE